MVGSNFFRTFAVTNRIRMQRHLFILIGLLLLSGSARADDSLPIIEVKADRTMIYPQRMELTVGNRVMFYHYNLMEGGIALLRMDVCQ